MNTNTGTIGAIIALVVGVGVGILTLVFVGSLGGQTYELVEDDLDTVGNHVVTFDYFTPINATTVYLDHKDIHVGTLVIANSTNDTILLANFTIDYDTGAITLITNHSNNTLHYANYTWGEIDIQNSIKEGIISGFDSLETTGNYMPIIVLAFVIALVLVFIMGYVSLGSKGNSGGAL